MNYISIMKVFIGLVDHSRGIIKVYNTLIFIMGSSYKM